MAFTAGTGSRAGLAAAAVGECIYVFGGHDGEGPRNSAEALRPQLPPSLRGQDGDACDDARGEWTRLPPMLARRAYLSAGVLEGKIYAVGGSADGRTLNTIDVFDTEAETWSNWFNIPPMQTKRTIHAATFAGNRLFVVGGYDGNRDLASVECLDPATKYWQWKSEMKTCRSYLALAVVGGSIYAIGGQDRKPSYIGPRAHETVEIFDPYCERWLPGPTLLTGRIGLAAAPLVGKDGKEYIYACGGSNGDDVLASVECLCVEEGKKVEELVWTKAPSMGVPRLGHAAAVVDNRLYVIGGFDGKEPLNTFECFDPMSNSWGPLLRMGADADTALTAPKIQISG